MFTKFAQTVNLNQFIMARYTRKQIEAMPNPKNLAGADLAQLDLRDVNLRNANLM